MPCIFCGNPGLTREHVYSRGWIKLLAQEATSFTNTRSVGVGEAVPQNTWVSSEADVVVRTVCGVCNNGWMNDLDAAVEPMVSTLARGEQKARVVDGALPVFARWAVKMALAMEGLMNPMVVPHRVRDHIRMGGTPPEGVRVWVATMQTWDGETRTVPMTLRSRPEMGEVEQAYLVTFRILHLVIQVLVPLHEDVQPEHDEWGTLHTEAAWPRSEPLEWPLPVKRMLASDEDLFRLTKSFRSRALRV